MRMRIARFATLFASVMAASPAFAADGWVAGHNSRIRLIAAPATYPDGAVKLTAGIEIALEPGWKTYWRTPGDAGGVPPEFDWKKSSNIGPATVLFPAPSRLTDPLGDSIGYKHSVLFPVTLIPVDASKPMMIDVVATYGVCAKICIPEEHELTLSVDPGDKTASDLLSRALASVPASGSSGHGNPLFVGLKFEPGNIIIDTQFPANTGDPQVFAEALDSSYVPMPERIADSGDGHTRFKIDLSKSDDLKTPSGKKLRLTLAGDASASEATATIP